MKTNLMRGSLLLVTLGMAIGASLAADPPKPPDDAAMKAMMQAMSPGPEHARLAKMAGTWNLKTTTWMVPGAPPTTNDAVSVRTMIMGGRYLDDQTKGSFAGMPFEGRGTTGFDNVDHKYYGTWIDNFGTGIMSMIGSCDNATRTCSFSSSMNDPVTGKPMKMRMVETCADDDHCATAFYAPGPDGKEYMSMKIDAERSK